MIGLVDGLGDGQRGSTGADRWRFDVSMTSRRGITNWHHDWKIGIKYEF